MITQFARTLRRSGLLLGLLLLAAACSRSLPTTAPAKTADLVAEPPTQSAVVGPASPPPTTIPTEPALPSPSPAPSPRASTATAQPPTSTPLAEAVTPAGPTLGQPDEPEAVIGVDSINVRSGPGTAFPAIGQASAGERFALLARNSSGDWWQIRFREGRGWVYVPLVTVAGNATVVPVTEEPPTPLPKPPGTQVQVYETTISIPTYPYAAFTKEATNPAFAWTYRRFDRNAYLASAPQPAPQVYTLVVLENEYLRLTLLPELGGRIYQLIFKPTGSNEFYQNPVIKPSPWGPPEQGGWLAAGGMEWGLPVEEHGYAWGDRWGHILLPFNQRYAGVTVFMPDEGHLRAEVDITLRAGEAAFSVQPRIVNPSDRGVSYKFWLNAMLAPGPANSPSSELRFLFPTNVMTVHSTGDPTLPASTLPLSWPVYQGRDLSRLGSFDQWLGFFERPAAHGPFAGAYDASYDEGVVRIFPPKATAGSKGFAFGWARPIDADNYTDDGSAYVELHGGLVPTFWDEATLAAGNTYTWQERWFPVAGIGGISYADGSGAVHLAASVDGLQVGVHSVTAIEGRLSVGVNDTIVLDEPAAVRPGLPWRRTLASTALPASARVTVTLFDGSGTPVLNYSQDMILH